ncbi:NAD-dependent dehydratase [Paraburkholderia sp. BL21I4N1]|uniref:NAD-dependent dehydratase n=1 Tax=Paraburkholderia sp. BL21I4N1 TaxID=1938801 RepID=UPI000CFDAAF2|nr:NAD-dependent dehydratase [Paraburkholderia sp. BL21I4N1]PQV45135.1 HIM1 protein [Paraburkholderia sp. BL21I4N1]
MKLLLLGATGLVGGGILKLALANDSVSGVIAPTRKPLAPSGKLVNPLGSRLEELAPILIAHKPDAVICALGTTMAKAGSKVAFRYVDYELPIALGNAAHQAGTETYAIVTAMGASAKSMSFYYRTKGEVEKEIEKIGFRSLTICRPSLIGGERNETRAAEGAMLTLVRLLAPILPKQFRVNPADAIAAALLDAVIVAKTGTRWIRAQEVN